MNDFFRVFFLAIFLISTVFSSRGWIDFSKETIEEENLSLLNRDFQSVSSKNLTRKIIGNRNAVSLSELSRYSGVARGKKSSWPTRVIFHIFCDRLPDTSSILRFYYPQKSIRGRHGRMETDFKEFPQREWISHSFWLSAFESEENLPEFSWNYLFNADQFEDGKKRQLDDNSYYWFYAGVSDFESVYISKIEVISEPLYANSEIQDIQELQIRKAFEAYYDFSFILMRWTPVVFLVLLSLYSLLFFSRQRLAKILLAMVFCFWLILSKESDLLFYSPFEEFKAYVKKAQRDLKSRHLRSSILYSLVEKKLESKLHEAKNRIREKIVTFKDKNLGLQEEKELTQTLEELRKTSGVDFVLTDGNKILMPDTGYKNRSQKEFVAGIWPMIRSKIKEGENKQEDEKSFSKLAILKDLLVGILKDIELLHLLLNNPNRLIPASFTREASEGEPQKYFWSWFEVDGNLFLLLGEAPSFLIKQEIAAVFANESRQELENLDFLVFGPWMSPFTGTLSEDEFAKKCAVKSFEKNSNLWLFYDRIKGFYTYYCAPWSAQEEMSVLLRKNLQEPVLQGLKVRRNLDFSFTLLTFLVPLFAVFLNHLATKPFFLWLNLMKDLSQRKRIFVEKKGKDEYAQILDLFSEIDQKRQKNDFIARFRTRTQFLGGGVSKLLEEIPKGCFFKVSVSFQKENLLEKLLCEKEKNEDSGTLETPDFIDTKSLPRFLKNRLWNGELLCWSCFCREKTKNLLSSLEIPFVFVELCNVEILSEKAEQFSGIIFYEKQHESVG